jgi:hypothetical protein
LIGPRFPRRRARRYDRADEGSNDRPGDRSHTPKSHDSAQARVRPVAIANLTAHRKLGPGKDAERRPDDRASDSPDPHVVCASVGRDDRGGQVGRSERRYRIPTDRRERSLDYSCLATKRCSRDE